MKRLRLIMVALALVIAAVAMATEPSKITVKYQGKKYYVHQVKEGDTLYSISKVYGVSQEVIMEVNDIEGTAIELGSSIFVPVVEKVITGNKASDADKRDDTYTEHVVKPGETLYSLSRTYGMTEEELLEINGLEDHASIKAGMTLRVKKSKAGKGKQKHSETQQGSTYAPQRGGDATADAEAQRDSRDDSSQLADTTGTQQSHFLGSALSDLFGDDEEAVTTTSTFAQVEQNSVLKVALVLPFTVDGTPKDNIVDFYRGVLLAMEDLKAEGRSIELTVLDTKGGVESLVQFAMLRGYDSQLIIGPVYAKEFAPVLMVAEEYNIPVVSPLMSVDIDSPVLFNMPAAAQAKDDKMSAMFDSSREVVYIYASKNDSAFINEARALSTAATTTQLNFKFDRGSYFYRRNSDGSNGGVVNIEELMRTKTPKTFVVVASQETDVDRILTTLSSIKASIRGRGLTYGDYVTYGNSKWLRMNSLDHDIFYHNDVIFAVSYYANRIDESVRLFDGRFVRSYGVLPSRNAYRGYDAAMIFCNMMFEGFDGFLGTTHRPLATPYRFERVNNSYENINWIRQHYRHDMKIVVE